MVTKMLPGRTSVKVVPHDALQVPEEKHVRYAIQKDQLFVTHKLSVQGVGLCAVREISIIHVQLAPEERFKLANRKRFNRY